MRVGDEVWARATLARVGESGRGHRVHIETDRVALVDGGGVAEIELALKDIRHEPYRDQEIADALSPPPRYVPVDIPDEALR